MITIRDNKLKVLAAGGDDGSLVSGELGTRVTCVLYVNYTKGDEDNLTITFDAMYSPLGDFYPIMFEDSPESVAPIVKKIDASGKYRLLITLADNESRLRVNAQLVNSSSSPGTAEIVVVPVTPTIG